MRVYSKRPQSSCVKELVERLALTTESVTLTAIVTAIRQTTACSRATAYRAVSDALREGSIVRVMTDAARPDGSADGEDMRRRAGEVLR
jgi:hypothetical protein